MGEGYTVYWGIKGFSLRIGWAGKKNQITIFDAYPEWAGVLTDKWAKEYDLPAEPYGKYRKSLTKSPAISSRISSGKRYIPYDMMSDSDPKLLLDATDTLLHALCGAPASQTLGA
jgi:hypothetical protein